MLKEGEKIKEERSGAQITIVSNTSPCLADYSYTYRLYSALLECNIEAVPWAPKPIATPSSPITTDVLMADRTTPLDGRHGNCSDPLILEA